MSEIVNKNGTTPEPDASISLHALIQDYRYAMAGCAVFLAIFTLSFLFGMTGDRELGNQVISSSLARIAESTACYLCMVFGAIVAFRTYNLVLAFIATMALVSPLMGLGAGAGFLSCIAYLVVMNSATQRLRSSGYRIGFTGNATLARSSTSVPA